MPKLDWKKYTLALTLTVVIFLTAIALSNFINNKKIENIRDIQDKIAIDILSSETQYSLLSESTCKDLSGNVLSDELGVLADKLTYTEGRLGNDSADLLKLKTYYTLLQIKDFLLMKKVSLKCNTKPVVILYFYTMDCSECEQQGYVLTYLRENYPNLRVYSFDYNLDNPALKTLISLYKIKDTTPAMVINDKVYNGFMDKDKLLGILPSLPKTTTSTATSTLK
jgi:hypothetical protein